MLNVCKFGGTSLKDVNSFLIVKNIKSFIISLENILVTIPKKDFLSRSVIYQEALILLDNVVKANYESDKEKKKDYQIVALAKVNLLDFFLERAYKLRYISEKQAISKANELVKINKMLYAWCKNER